MKAVFKTTGGKEPVQGAISYSAGETIFSQGDLGTEMFIILEGDVHIVKHIANEAHVLSRLEKGDFFGEMALLESAPRTADAVAQSEVKLLAINALMQSDEDRAIPMLEKILNGNSSPKLKERALFKAHTQVATDLVFTADSKLPCGSRASNATRPGPPPL